jgi:hypothetical protein
MTCGVTPCVCGVAGFIVGESSERGMSTSSAHHPPELLVLTQNIKIDVKGSSTVYNHHGTPRSRIMVLLLCCSVDRALRSRTFLPDSIGE